MVANAANGFSGLRKHSSFPDCLPYILFLSLLFNTMIISTPETSHMQ